MAAPNPTDKVKDKEYSNWLKVTLSLYYMKSGLHTFIWSEINHLHLSLVHKIYGGQTVPLPPCTTCNASLVNRNKFTGVWEFKKQCSSYCYVWLHELLKPHANPKSEKIYWDNSDVPSWPFKPWECAKVFMPRGQQSSSAGPAECDAQALLTLLASCTHFHPKLSSQGLGLTHTISTVRNKLMHDGEMNVSDADTRNYIQQIIQLLEDSVSLKSLEDCKAAVCNIHKVHNDSVDVFLNVDQEMIALKTAVDEVRQEFGMQEKRTFDTVESLKDEYRQLREQLATNLKKLTDVEARVDINERDIQLIKEQADISLQKQEMHTTETSQLTKRYEETDARVDIIVQDVQSVKEQIDTALQQHETFSGSMENMSAIVASHGVRIDAVEENLIKLQGTRQRTEQNNTCVKEISSIRRPESDGLRQLKSQTEDKLDTVKRLGFVPTKQMEEAKKLIQVKKSIVIQGNPGEGKTTTAILLIDNEWCIDRRVLVRSPGDWRMVDTDWVDIVILEDIFGQFDLDQSRLQNWLLVLPTIQEHVDAGKLQVIITTRVDILKKAKTHLGSINLFSDEFSLTLSSDKLQESEKMDILNRELKRRKRDMQDDAKKECIANFNGLIGFPQCCLLFAGDKGLFVNGPDFFKEPVKLFYVNIDKLDPHRFLSLAFLFCAGSILEKYLSPEVMPEVEKDVLIELSSHLCISKEMASITLLRESYDNFSGLYVKKCHSSIMFSHYTVLEAVGLVLGERSIEMVVKYCNDQYLNQRTYTAESKDNTSCNVFIPVSAYRYLAERIINDALHGLIMFSRPDKHSAIKQHEFLIELKDQLQKFNRMDYFLYSKNISLHFQNRAEGECETFLECVLQSDRNTAMLVYDQFLEFLICSHNIDRFDTECRKCIEKKSLLELALYYNQLNIADKLIARNACVSPISLCNAVRHGNLNRVKTIIERLKRYGSLDTQDMFVRKSLCRAFVSGNRSLVELLLNEGIELDSSHVMCVVKQGDMDALQKLVDYLKHNNDWDPLHEKGNQEHLESKVENFYDICPSIEKELQFSKALFYAYREEKMDMAEFLLKEGVKVTMDMFLAVFQHGSNTATKNVLQDLKDTNQWNPESYCVSKAQELACFHDYNLYEMMIEKEVSFTMKNLPGVVAYRSEESVTKVLQHLKFNSKWYPKSDYASQALKIGFNKEIINVCVLFVEEGIPLTMDIITDIRCRNSLGSIIKVIEHLRETNKWDPKSDIASETLKLSFIKEMNDVSEQLLQEGVKLAMSDLPGILYNGSRDSIIKAIHHLKDNGKWGVAIFYLSETLIDLLRRQKYDVYDLLIQQGVMLKLDDLRCVVEYGSIDYVIKSIQHLKDTGNWDPRSQFASNALIGAYITQKYDICGILILESVKLSLTNLSCITYASNQSVDSVKRAIQHLQDTNSWYPKCEYLSTELENAYRYGKYSLCDLLIQEGVSLSMKNLPGLMDTWVVGKTLYLRSYSLAASVESVNKAIQHLKSTNNWDSNSCYALMALESACEKHMFDVSNLLCQEGVSFTMKNLLDVISVTGWTTKQYQKEKEFLVQRIAHLKDTDAWDPLSEFVTEALKKAFSLQKYAVIYLLLQEYITPNMMMLPDVVCRPLHAFVTDLVQQMKRTHTWDHPSHLASDALVLVFNEQKYNFCFDILFHENISPTMNIFYIAVSQKSNEFVTKLLQRMKIANTWDPSSNLASDALELTFRKQNHDLGNLFVHEKVVLTMENLPGIVRCGSIEPVTKAIQLLKDANHWDPSSPYATEALETAFGEIYLDGKQKCEVSDLLIQEGVSLKMKDFKTYVPYEGSYKFFKSIIDHLKDKGNWDPHSESAVVALQSAYQYHMDDICDLLIQEGIMPTLESLIIVPLSLQSVSKLVQYLKDKGNWNPHCKSASVALQKAYECALYDVCDLLIQEGTSPTMENLLHAMNVPYPSQEVMYDVCGMEIEEERITMANLPYRMNVYWQFKTSVSKVVKHLKDKGSWNPHDKIASFALKEAFLRKRYDVCDLLIQEGILVTMENLIHVINVFQPSLESVSEVVQHLKNKGNWDPHCKSASVALQQANRREMPDICNLLIQEGISPRSSISYNYLPHGHPNRHTDL